MLSRVVLSNARKLAQSNVGVSATRVCAYHQGTHVQTTLNDMPVPQGSWQAAHDSKQRKYNLHLLFGIGFAVSTLVVAKASGLFHFNFSVPKLKEE